MFGFYFFCGLAFMGKGIPGFALPGMIALLYLVGSKRWTLLLEGRLRVGVGMLIVMTVGLPWYVAMFIRHGGPFIDRLLVHDHINRLAAGVHGDNGSIEYFMEQLGFATFPWIALVPAGLTLWAWWTPDDDDDDVTLHRRQTLLLLTLWFVGAFTLFSAMVTKFHHYIFPAGSTGRDSRRDSPRPNVRERPSYGRVAWVDLQRCGLALAHSIGHRRRRPLG